MEDCSVFVFVIMRGGREQERMDIMGFLDG